MSFPYFSVIIPTHDRHEMLSEAVSSVLRQTFEDFEVIVVDDASPVPVQAPADSRVSIIRREISGGPARARNDGLRRAKGEVVGFLDDDDLWTKHRLHNAYEAHNGADLVICRARHLGERGEEPREWHIGRGPLARWILEDTTPHLGATTIARQICPMFDPRYDAAEDLDWWLRTAETDPSYCYIDSADWVWRRHEGVRHGIGTEARIRGQLRLLDQHSAYFAFNKRARSFRWLRIGALRMASGDPRGATAALFKSVAASPDKRVARVVLGILLRARATRSERSLL